MLTAADRPAAHPARGTERAVPRIAFAERASVFTSDCRTITTEASVDVVPMRQPSLCPRDNLRGRPTAALRSTPNQAHQQKMTNRKRKYQNDHQIRRLC